MCDAFIENKRIPISVSKADPIHRCTTFLENPLSTIGLQSCLSKSKGRATDVYMPWLIQVKRSY